MTAHSASQYDFGNKPLAYEELAGALHALLSGERDLIANAANTAALIYAALPDINWCGFYFLHDSELVLGPFQGQPACVRIALGRGVCGTAAALRTTQVVADVHKFPGHIACDAASRSELVVPLLRTAAAGQPPLLGVLDIDSPLVARFDNADARGVERLAHLFIDSLG